MIPRSSSRKQSQDIESSAHHVEGDGDLQGRREADGGGVEGSARFGVDVDADDLVEIRWVTQNCEGPVRIHSDLSAFP